MECIIPGGSIKVFSNIINCMSSFGTEVIFSCFRDQLVLSIGDNTDTCLCQFKLNSAYFQSYLISNELNDNNMYEEISCKVNLESLQQIFQGIGSDEKLFDSLHIKLERPNPNASTFIEDLTIFFELKLTNRLSKINKLTYFGGARTPLIMSDPSKWNNIVVLPAKVLLNWIKKFQTKGQDLWMTFNRERVILKTRDTSLSTRGPGNWKLSSELTLGVDDFIKYQIRDNSGLSFSAKDIKTLSKFAESIKSDVELYFNEAGSPINFEVKFSSIVTGQLYVPALNSFNSTNDGFYDDPMIVVRDQSQLDQSTISEISIYPNKNHASTHQNSQASNITLESKNHISLSLPLPDNSFRLPDSPIITKSETQPQNLSNSGENTSGANTSISDKDRQRFDGSIVADLSVGNITNTSNSQSQSIQLPSSNSLPLLQNIVSSTPVDFNSNNNQLNPFYRKNIIQTSSSSQDIENRLNNSNSQPNIRSLNKNVIHSSEDDDDDDDDDDGEVPGTPPPKKVFKLFS